MSTSVVEYNNKRYVGRQTFVIRGIEELIALRYDNAVSPDFRTEDDPNETPFRQRIDFNNSKRKLECKLSNLSKRDLFLHEVELEIEHSTYGRQTTVRRHQSVTAQTGWVVREYELPALEEQQVHYWTKRFETSDHTLSHELGGE